VLDCAALMALNPETIVWARIGVSDMLLTAAGALLSFQVCPAVKTSGTSALVSAFMYQFLCCFDKGPVGLSCQR